MYYIILSLFFKTCELVEANLKLTSPLLSEEPPQCSNNTKAIYITSMTLILIFNFCCRTFATGGC